jgi:uncharacterized protein YecT (DUF1311 family)
MVPPTQLHGVPSILDYQWDESYWNAEHQQQMLNVKSSEWCAILDGKLFIIYSKLADQCGKNRKTQLAADQTAWLNERAKSLKAELWNRSPIT